MSTLSDTAKFDAASVGERARLRGWVAHIFHMKVAGDPFKEPRGSGWKPSAQMADPSRKAAKIAAQWIRNYAAFDFRSLGSHTRADLERIAAGPEAF